MDYSVDFQITLVCPDDLAQSNAGDLVGTYATVQGSTQSVAVAATN